VVERGPRDDPFTAEEDHVLTEVSRQLGLVLHDAHLGSALESTLAEVRRQADELRDSRARVVAAADAERRRIERDLHDGAQQRLVTLGIVLRRLQRSLPREAQILGPALDAAVEEIGRAIDDLRTIAAGIRPPRLDEGLAAALADLVRGAPVPVELESTQERLAPQIEAAAYFVVSEGVTNAVKHASPSRVRVEATVLDGTLRLVVADDGVGGATLAGGTGLVGLTDRVEAQGGTLTLDSPPGAGTRLEAEIPCGS
jgi:signal transduction histidine kinase